MSLSSGSRLSCSVCRRGRHEHSREGEVAVGRGSGNLTSILLDFGDGEYIGILMEAERLRDEYARLMGASNPGTSLRYELVPGLQNALRARACFSMPPM